MEGTQTVRRLLKADNGKLSQILEYDSEKRVEIPINTFIVRNRKGEEIGKITKHFVILMRNPSKAKKGECIFIEESLFLKAIRFLTMGLYDKMKEQYENAPDTLFNIVGMSAYQTLTTAAAGDGYIQIPLNNILIIKDREVLSDPMKVAVVKSVPVQYRKFEIDFDDPKVEKIINRHDCTFDPETAKEKGYTLIGKSREDLSANSIRVNVVKEPGFGGSDFGDGGDI